MVRSPLTLAASVTAALPGSRVVSVSELTERAAGRYDTAVAVLDDGRELVVRAATDPETGTEQRAQARALRALSAGVRALLPFRAPELVGEARVGEDPMIVTDRVVGYRVDATAIPAGNGIATAIGTALAAVHEIPPSIVRADGLPVRTRAQVRDEERSVIERAAATERVPVGLLTRWRRAVEDDELWQMEPTVVLGGATADSFYLSDGDDGPRVVGIVDWHGLSVGDPAVDLRWLASIPETADHVFAAYVTARLRTVDPSIRIRARLYAELEFARYLLHGAEIGSEEIMADAEQLLTSLSNGVRLTDLAEPEEFDIDEAVALVGQVPEPLDSPIDTSIHTDTYEPGSLMGLFDDLVGADVDPALTDTGPITPPRPAAEANQWTQSIPIPDLPQMDTEDLSGEETSGEFLARSRRDHHPPVSAKATRVEAPPAWPPQPDADTEDDDEPDPTSPTEPLDGPHPRSAWREAQHEVDQAARAARRRWASSSSE